MFSMFKENYTHMRYLSPKAFSECSTEVFAKPHYSDAWQIKTLSWECVCV